MRGTLSLLALGAGLVLFGSGPADASDFNGTWSVHLVADGGACGSGSSHTLMVENGNVRGSSVSVSGHVAPTGSVTLALQKGLVQGSASGKLSGASGSGSWTVSSLGC